MFVTQDRASYYYLLAACPPDRNRLGMSRAAKRLSNGLRMFQRKRRTVSAMDKLRNVSEESLWETGSESGGGEVLVAGDQSATKSGTVKKRRQKTVINVAERVLEMSTIRESDKEACLRIEFRDLVKMNRAIHNRKVERRRRTIERKTPLYNKLRANVRKKENSE